MKKLGFALIAALLSTNALADAVICNDATNFDQVAFSWGHFDNQGNVTTSGWYYLKANTCGKLIKADLNTLYNKQYFLKLFGVKGEQVVEFKSNHQAIELCAKDAERWVIDNAHNLASCKSKGGTIQAYYQAQFANGKHDIINIENPK